MAGTHPAADVVASPVRSRGRAMRHALMLLGGWLAAQLPAGTQLGDRGLEDVLAGVDALRAQGHLDAAQRATEHLWRAHTVLDPPARLELLRRLADLAILQDDDVAARRWIDVWCKEGRAGGSVVDEALRLELEGRVARVSGRYGDARATFERLLDLRRRQAAPGVQRAAALDALADVERIEGRYARAETLSREAVDTIRREAGADATERTRYEARLAQILFDQDDEPAAMERFQAALEFARTALGSNHPTVAMVHQYIGNARLGAGAYADADAAFESAQEILDAFPDRGYLEERAILAHNRASLAARLGDLEQAHEGFERTIVLWTQAKGPGHPHIAWTLQELGRLAGEAGDDRQAHEFFEQAVELRRKWQPESTVLAESLAALARSHVRLGRCDVALDLSQSAVVMSTRATAGRETIERLADRAWVEAACGRGAAARRHFEHALSLARTRLGAEHPFVHELLAGLARVHLSRGAAREALRCALPAARGQVRLARRVLAYLPEADGLAFAARVRLTRDLMIAALLQGRDSAADRAAVLDLVADGRALVEEAAVRRARRQRAARDPARVEPLRQLEQLRARYAALVWRGQGDTSVEQVRRLEGARIELERAESAIARVFGGPTEDEPAITTAGLLAALPPSTALVSFVRTSPLPGTADGDPGAYAALIVRRERAVTLVNLGRAAVIESVVAAFRAVLDPPDRRTRRGHLAEARDEHRAREAGRAMTALLWQPLAAHLRGADRILLVPDGMLALIPFGALPLGGGYLMEAGPSLHLLGSERDLLRPAASRQGQALVALGAAEYDRGVAWPAALEGAKRRDSFVRPPGMPRFEALPATGAEIRGLAAHWRTWRPGEDVVLLTGAGAGEAALRSAVPRARVLHLATHGFFLDAPRVGRLNQMTRSGLALAGVHASGAPGEDDGMLTSLEVSALDLDACEWAVLSACGSALGPVQDGEGVLGLRRALVIAGARTVVMSLMRVEDTAAQRFMTELYQARLVRRLPTDEALRQASLARLNALRRAGRPTPPYEWAAFVAAGDWR